MCRSLAFFFTIFNLIAVDDISASTPSPITKNYHSNEPPNFIIIVIDDMLYTKTLNKTTNGAAGTKLRNDTVRYLDIATPNIQRILNEAIVFPRSYCGGPKCSPARFSIITGRHVSRNEFAQHRTLQSSTGYLGTNVTIQSSKLLMNDSIYNIPYQLQNNPKQSWHTGMVGKWHLQSADDNRYDYNCSTLDIHSDADLYQKCAAILTHQGFDFVDAYYHENIGDAVDYGHNPEWIVNEAERFIDQAVHVENKPFFLYMAHTLTHDPDAYSSMFNYSIRNTPKGYLKNSDIPIKTGMAQRTDLWRRAVNESWKTDKNLNYAAMYMWVDNSIGALIDYLQELNIYNNTFIVVVNDHGMGSKGTLYEQGTRIFQFIRFPPLFSIDSPKIMSDNFVVSTIDLASVIFDIAGITDYIDPNYILDDSVNWIEDVINDINGKETKYECCKYRIQDIRNSHSIVMRDWKYIYRATPSVETDGDVCSKYYPNCFEEEQLYHLVTDPNEQFNLIYNESFSDIIYTMQSLMIEYIQNVACPIDHCKAPNITFMPTSTGLLSTNGVTIQSSINGTSKGNNNATHGISDFMIVLIVLVFVVIIMVIVVYCVGSRKWKKWNQDKDYIRMNTMK